MQEPVVFLPGTQCDERLFLPLWREMSLSDRRYVPLQWAETLEQMDGLTDYAVAGDRVHLVGFSMGGYIASRFALANPRLVASLTLIGFCSAGLTAAEKQHRQLVIRALEKGPLKAMPESRLVQMVNIDGVNAQQAIQSIREMEQDLGSSVLKYHLQSASERGDLTAALANSGLKINLISAEFDQVAPLQKMQQMHQQIPGSRFILLADSGHMAPLESPGVLAQALYSLHSGANV
ncbi:alpha/beta fold hydrolase [Lacimicrobium alkaliphilum]|uniref:Alpha/beta hydrolase n=1 Tax=Lacimicrobium alkaliphilum TaxID=1526571 RepID=A0ABQ1RCA7_9ALTE|nr:alpha/beta hydrolase [Lacimicrobium alkaliphilum]GGD62094.1 alpha/beta hydrolase [Lacimicrobium alkaliphilum]